MPRRPSGQASYHHQRLIEPAGVNVSRVLGLTAGVAGIGAVAVTGVVSTLLWLSPAGTDTRGIDRSGERYFASCKQAKRAGVAPILRGQPGYRDSLDADGDGVACEPYFGR